MQFNYANYLCSYCTHRIMLSCLYRISFTLQRLIYGGAPMKKRCLIFMVLISCFLVGCAHKLKGITDKWVLNDNSVMVIKDNEFFWYQNQKNLNDNYFYADNIKILQGEDAINAINAPTENRNKLLKTHIYYINVTYTSYKIEGKDLSSELDKKPSEFAIQMGSKDSLNIINLNTNASYTARRMKTE